MKTYIRYSLALTPTENERFLKVKAREKLGIKKIFKAMLDALEPPRAQSPQDTRPQSPTETKQEEEI